MRKQGSADVNNNGGQKREPVASAVNPKYVATIGISQYTQPEPMHKGRGFNAPAPSSQATHKGGSQGKYR